MRGSWDCRSEHLEARELSYVFTEVARLRRERLIHVIARAIALDLLRPSGS